MFPSAPAVAGADFRGSPDSSGTLPSLACQKGGTKDSQDQATKYRDLYGLSGAGYGSFRKLGVPYFGVLIIRILRFRVHIKVPYFRKLPYL